MKNFRLTVIAALLAFSASQAAFAQAPAPGEAPGGAPAAGTTADDGTISNASSSTTTTTTTTTNGGISPDVDIAVTPVEGEVVATNLTNTGGEPLLMSVAGLAIAMSAFALRRKVSA